MAVLYPATSVSGYNANPPPDDGTTVPTNLEKWSDVKTKIGDPLNTFAAAIDSNLTAAFGKTLDGASIVSTGTNYPMSAADQGRLIKATASGITITTPDAATVTAPFTFAVSNQSSGQITLAGNATGAQTVDGQTTQVIKSGAGCIVKTDGTNWITFGLKTAQLTSVNPPYGFDAAINLGLAASVNSNILTVAVQTNAGTDPTPGDPVLIPFRDASLPLGDPVWIAITVALSINTNAVGATLGSQNGVPFRLWILAFNNAGTPLLALWHSGSGAATPAINPLVESIPVTTTGISAAATSAGVFYTPNGSSLAIPKSFRILGYLDYASGLATAGTYASVPTKLQLFGPGLRKPGDTIQIAYSGDGVASVSISPSSSINPVLISGFVGLTSGSATVLAAKIMRAAVQVGATLNSSTALSGGTSFATVTWAEILDNPATTSATTWTITAVTGSLNHQSITAKEIMG